MQLLTLSPDQELAVTAIRSWLSDLQDYPQSRPWFYTFGGLAGTGKSTIVHHLISLLASENIAVCATTGKAAQVLISKGVGATTLHSLIYNVEEDDNGDPIFLLKRSLPYTLIICDEASMISTDLFTDLRTLGIPTLFVGDHGQLEPVGDSPDLMQKPDTILEKIHRQAADNPIIPFAHHIRSGYGITYQQNGPLTVCPLGQLNTDPTQSQIIVAYNNTRHTWNKTIRDHKNFTKPIHESESLICLRNNSRLNVFNGQQFQVQQIHSQNRYTTDATVLPDFGDPRRLLITHKSLYGAEAPSFGRTPFAFMDYAYAITCHKAQGSQWPSVIVIDEGGDPPWSSTRWSYTAATRAAKNLTYCC